MGIFDTVVTHDTKRFPADSVPVPTPLPTCAVIPAWRIRRSIRQLICNIERHLSFHSRRQRPPDAHSAQQKLLNVVDDFAGVEDADGFGSLVGARREVFQQQVADLRHLLRRGQRTKQPHQIVIPRRRSASRAKSTARWRCAGPACRFIASTCRSA